MEKKGETRLYFHRLALGGEGVEHYVLLNYYLVPISFHWFIMHNTFGIKSMKSKPF